MSPSSRSPAPKIQRTAMEAHKTLATSRNTPRMYVAQPSMHMLTVTDFKPSVCELESVAQLRHDIYTYLWLIKSSIPEKALIDYCMLTKPRESCIVYFDVLDAIADIKETVLLVLDKLRTSIVEANHKQRLVVAGDAKLQSNARRG